MIEVQQLFGADEDLHRIWREWRGMPEFTQDDLEAWETVTVHFATEADLLAFEAFTGRKAKRERKRLTAVWYPKSAIGGYIDKRYVTREPVAPRYPLYIVSKGRAKTQLTSRALHRMGLPHYIVVEGDQLADYQANANPSATYLVLDPDFQRRYDRLLPPDDPSSPGSGPARNFAWEHSIGLGYARHWVMDDNLDYFIRFNRNLKTPVFTGATIAAMEDFVDRYTNVAMAGPNYFMFAVRKNDTQPPFYLNTRIYSCNLIRNDLPQRWRGRYNEDTILSLDLLKAGHCTILFNAFLQYKRGTQTMAGGNTTELYGSGTLAKSQMLVDAHPDVARHSKRFHGADGEKRDHHTVDYKPFWRANHLALREDVEIVDETNNYGMILERWDKSIERWVPMYGDVPWYPWEDGR